MVDLLHRERLKKYFIGDSNGPYFGIVNGDPSQDNGLIAPEGSIVIWPDAPGGSITYRKSGPINTDWDVAPDQTGSKGIEALERYGAYAFLTQNDDGGWNFSDDAFSTPIRSKTDISFNNHFGFTPQRLVEIYNLVPHTGYLNSARQALEAWADETVDPFNRFFPDIVEALIKLGDSEGPLNFRDYFDKGKEAAEAEINFYKTIEVWHLDGNGPSTNPPVGDGMDGNLLDIWTNRQGEVEDIDLAAAAQRFYDRFNAVRTKPVLVYDFYQRMRYAEALSNETIGSVPESFSIFGQELAKLFRDNVWGEFALNENDAHAAFARSVSITKLYEGVVANLDGIYTQALQTLIGLKQETAGIDNGWYADVDRTTDPDTYYSGTKQDQGFTLQALVEAGEDDAARELAEILINAQHGTGNWQDFFDLDPANNQSYLAEANSDVALAMYLAIQNNVI